MDSKTSPRDLYILGMLSLRRTYGHEIVKAIKASRADMWVALSEKHVYYVLQKFARQGLVTETEERKGNRPPRRVYEITEIGRDVLRKMLLSESLRDTFIPSPFDSLLGMLAYTDVLEPEEAKDVLRKRREILATRLAQEYPKTYGQVVEHRYGFLARGIYDKARTLLIAELQWLEAVLDRVERDDWASLKVPRNFLDSL